MLLDNTASRGMMTKNTDSGFDPEPYLIDLRANIGNIGHLLLDRQEQGRIREKLIEGELHLPLSEQCVLSGLLPGVVVNFVVIGGIA